MSPFCVPLFAFNVPFLRSIRQVEASWDEELDERITDEFLAELEAMDSHEEHRCLDKVNWTKEGF